MLVKYTYLYVSRLAPSETTEKLVSLGCNSVRVFLLVFSGNLNKNNTTTKDLQKFCLDPETTEKLGLFRLQLCESFSPSVSVDIKQQ